MQLITVFVLFAVIVQYNVFRVTTTQAITADETTTSNQVYSHNTKSNLKSKKKSKNFEFIISETNVDNPYLNENEIFIEIQTQALKPKGGTSPSHILSDFMLLLVKTEPLQVQLVINFNHQTVKIGPEKLFVLISFDKNADVKLSGPAATLVGSGNTNKFGECSQTACALILIENHYRRELNELKLFRNIINEYQPLDINNDIRKQDIISRSAVDILVYGRTSILNRNSFFDKLLRENNKAGYKYLLRTTNQQTKTTYPSLNYCASSISSFNVYAFEQGQSSPGSENICSGTFVVLNPNIVTATNVIHQPQPTIRPSLISTPALEMSSEALATAAVQRDLYSSVDFESRPVQMSSHVQATPVLSSSMFSATAVPRLPDTQTINWKNPYSPPAFNDEWIGQCKTRLPNSGRVMQYSFIRPWLQVSSSNGVCKFSCHVCKKYYELGFRSDIKNKKNIVKDDGYNSASPSNNEDEIKNHPTDAIHQKATQLLQKLSVAKTQSEYEHLLNEEMKEQLPIFKPTMIVLNTVYTMIKANIPFSQLPRLSVLLKYSGVVLGQYQQTPGAAQKIAATISLSFRKKLLKHLVDYNKEFTLLADESTDRGSISLLIVYFQTLEEGFPITYFYGLVELDEGQTAVKTFQKLKDRILQDDILVPGFQAFFKSKIALFVSDSANSMVGEKNSVLTNINTFIYPRQINVFKCIAHKIELVMEWSIKRQADSDVRFSYLNKFNVQINRFYSFFMSQGSKRWLYLQEIGQELSETPKRLKYVYQTRWADSRYQSLKKLEENYNLLKPALIAMDENNEYFNADAQTKARDLYNLLQDQSFSICLREFLDLLGIYRTLSLQFQKSASILVGKANYVEKAYKDIMKLKTSPGDYVKKFISECFCRYGCGLGSCTLQDFDNCREIVHNGYSLEKTENNRILLSQVRNELYTAMGRELDVYLNLEILIAVQLFDNREMVFSKPKSNIHPGSELQPMRKYYNMNYEFFKEQSASTKLARVCAFYFVEESACTQLAREWRILVHNIVGHSFLWDYKDELPEKFWPLALLQSDLPWTALTRNIIEKTLVSGNNDAISERGFSIMDFTKSKGRSRLSPKTVEDIINIRENGPDDITNLASFEYTIEYLKNHYRSDQEWNLGGRPLNEDNFKSFFQKSRLF